MLKPVARMRGANQPSLPYNNTSISPALHKTVILITFIFLLVIVIVIVVIIIIIVVVMIIITTTTTTTTKLTLFSSV